MAEPPPIPTTKSAPKARAASPARLQVETRGFSPTWEKTSHSTRCIFRAVHTSSRAPLLTAPLLPVTSSALSPSDASCWECSSTHPLSKYTWTGM